MIVVTGLSGVGKSLILQESELKNVHYMDEVVKTFYKRNFKLYWDIKEEFGSSVVNFFRVNASKLGKIVFNDPVKLKKLDSIVRPYVETYLNILLQDKDNQHIVEMAAYLKLESWYKKYFNKVVLIDRPTNLDNKFKYMNNKKQPLKKTSIKYDLLIKDEILEVSINMLKGFIKK
ncbi:MAG: dephospho-CoA kinase [Mycoplasmataceae bacterium]|nr:dephospho-CoA kinase [Mycoplasmataceae bacterium]